jgi:hypothetical protein
MNTQINVFDVLVELLQFQFGVSYGWVKHFMARHNLTVRCGTVIAQRLPKHARRRRAGQFAEISPETEKAA